MMRRCVRSFSSSPGGTTSTHGRTATSSEPRPRERPRGPDEARNSGSPQEPPESGPVEPQNRRDHSWPHPVLRMVERVKRGSGRRVALRCWFAVAAQQRAHFRLTEPAVPAGGADARDAPGGRPPGDGLRIHPEQRGYLSRREQTLVVAVHVQCPPTVAFKPLVRYASSLALNEYFLPRFLEIRSVIRVPFMTYSYFFTTLSSNRTSSARLRSLRARSGHRESGENRPRSGPEVAQRNDKRRRYERRRARAGQP